MAVIDEDLMRTVVKALKNESSITDYLGKDKNDNFSIRPGSLVPSGIVLPAITVDVVEDESEPKFPASRDNLTITIWIDDKVTRQYLSFLKGITDKILTLFNREGGIFNNIDIPTNSGVRYCRFLKRGVSFDYEVPIKMYYGEVIFEVIRSEDESFKPSDAGDRSWV